MTTYLTNEQAEAIRLKYGGKPKTEKPAVEAAPQIVRKRKYTKKPAWQRLQIKQERERAAQELVEAAMTTQEWHQHNRTKFTPEELAQLQERQEAVYDTMWWMQQNMDGTYDPLPENYVSLQEGVADLNDDMKKFGTTYYWGSLFTHSEIYRRSEEFRNIARKCGHPVFAGKNASEIFLMTGILVAVPSQQAHDFRRMNCITAGLTEQAKPARPYAGVVRTVTKKEKTAAGDE